MENNIKKEVIVGIDLGTTFSVIGVYAKNDVQFFQQQNTDKDLVPSKVLFTGDRVLVGTAATYYFSNPRNSNKPEVRKNYFYDIKRIIGRRFNDPLIAGDLQSFTFGTFPADPNDLSSGILVDFQHSADTPREKVAPEVISAIILKKLKSMAEDALGVAVKKCVITVPAHFSHSERASTAKAAELAGLDPVRIINEPTAAAFAYGDSDFGLNKNRRNIQRLLVFDLGGGTFDVSVMSYRSSDNSYNVTCSGGDLHLGGRDFDKNLEQLILKKIREECRDIRENTIKSKVIPSLAVNVEEIKKQLSVDTTTLYYQDTPDGEIEINITREEFEEVNQDLFKRCIVMVRNLLQEAAIEENSIDEFILVGGSSKIPKIQSMIEGEFKMKPNIRINADYAVAYGAAALAHSISLGNSVPGSAPNVSYFDVTNFALGIVTEGKNLDPILPKFTLVPQGFTQRYYSLPGAEAVLVQVYQIQVESQLAHPENKKLGEFRIHGLPRSSQMLPFDISIHINANNMVTCKATCVSDQNLSKELGIDIRNTSIISKVEEEAWKAKLENLTLSFK